jgi:hypothetical protein
MCGNSNTSVTIKTKDCSSFFRLFLEGNGDKKTFSSEDIGIISPGFFMALRDADFHEDDVSRSVEPDVVTQTSHAAHQSHLHPQSLSSDRFMFLLQTVSGKHFELPESERKYSPRHPNKLHQHYESSARRRITKLPSIY